MSRSNIILLFIFYREGIDHIINLYIYDQRFELTGWNIMEEINNPHIDIPLISSSLIPSTNDVFWSDAAIKISALFHKTLDNSFFL